MLNKYNESVVLFSFVQSHSESLSALNEFVVFVLMIICVYLFMTGSHSPTEVINHRRHTETHTCEKHTCVQCSDCVLRFQAGEIITQRSPEFTAYTRSDHP